MDVDDFRRLLNRKEILLFDGISSLSQSCHQAARDVERYEERIRNNPNDDDARILKARAEENYKHFNERMRHVVDKYDDQEVASSLLQKLMQYFGQNEEQV